MESVRRETRKIIASAFDGVPRPDTSLRQFVLTDQKGMSGTITKEEWRLAGIMRTDAKWQDISRLEIEHCDCQRAHMQAGEFRYHLPAYMTYALDHAQDSAVESMIPGAVVFGLTPGKDHPAHSIGQYRLLDPRQRKTVAAFLDSMAHYADDYDRKDAARVLAFWQRDA